MNDTIRMKIESMLDLATEAIAEARKVLIEHVAPAVTVPPAPRLLPNGRPGTKPGSHAFNPVIPAPAADEPEWIKIGDACTMFNIGYGWLAARIKSGQIAHQRNPSPRGKKGKTHLYVRPQAVRVFIASGMTRIAKLRK